MRQRAEILLVTGVLTRIFLLGARCLRPYSAIGMLMRTACLLPLALLAPGHAFAADAVALDNSVFVERVTTDASGKQRVLLEEPRRSEEHTSELQSLMRISYAVFCLKKKK